MAWTTPRTWTASETPSASTMNTHIRDQFDFIAAEPHELWLRRNANQTISNATQTAISWDTEQRDVGFGFTPTSSTITVQQTGIYSIFATCQWVGGASSDVAYIGISVGGTQVQGNGGNAPANNEGNQKATAATLRITSSTTVQIIVFQQSGASRDIQDTGATGTLMRICQVQRTVS